MNEVFILPINSEKTDKINPAFLKAQMEFPIIEKTTKGQYGMYADKTEILDKIVPILTKYGLTISIDHTIMTSGSGEIVRLMICALRHDTSDQWIKSYEIIEKFAPAENFKWGGTLTYKARYVISNMLGLRAGEEDEEIDRKLNRAEVMACNSLSDDRKKDILNFTGVKRFEDMYLSQYEEYKKSR